jgi:hypothetical protein
MKGSLIAVILMFCITACSFTKPHEKMAQDQARQADLSVVAKPRFDSTFISSTMHFGEYSKLKIDNLDLSNVKIVRPSVQTTLEKPWELNDSDKNYYQAKYMDAAKKSLIDSDLYSLASEAGEKTLLLKAKIIQIAPLGPKDELNSRTGLMDVYSEGFGRMTIAFEVYDSLTNKLVLTATDEHDLGKMWEKNNRVQNNLQIRLAFDYWLNNLKVELEHAAKE